ncbi:MAG: ATP-binding cassette domain-containing protein, partial [Lachnospiraceae bacterium]|nr:ATP-binding cassette domain-containing protein [Lachnospiraceae bacterium]
MSAFLELKNVSYSYDPQAKEPRWAVKDVSLSIEEGEFIALIGHTGSGKSTLIQFFDGLLAPTEGQVLFQGQDTREKGFSMKMLRQNVGLVFQYPEHQLFEMTRLKDACYGPKNLKLPKEEQEARAKEALQLVGFTEKDFDRSPFDLSGGRKRRAAIAGVLAMKPRML